jgi:CheY-like chemotaxis protein
MKKLTSVLLIDDSDDDNWYHRMVLEQSGLAQHITIISDSRKALACWQDGFSNLEQLPQLIFVDINMPAFNGFELVDRIRKSPDPHKLREKIKIFMLTGSINPDDYKRATTEFKGIIIGYHLKPLSAKTISEIIQKHFSEENE